MRAAHSHNHTAAALPPALRARHPALRGARTPTTAPGPRGAAPTVSRLPRAAKTYRLSCDIAVQIDKSSSEAAALAPGASVSVSLPGQPVLVVPRRPVTG